MSASNRSQPLGARFSPAIDQLRAIATQAGDAPTGAAGDDSAAAEGDEEIVDAEVVDEAGDRA